MIPLWGVVALVGGGLTLAIILSLREGRITSIPGGLAFGKDVPASFARKVVEIGKRLQIDPSFLMAMMRHESGFNTCAHINKVGVKADGTPLLKSLQDCGSIGATTIGGGLIGFMRRTATLLGIQLETLLHSSALTQLDYVEKFYQLHLKSGVLKPHPTMNEVFFATFLPKFVKRANDINFVLSRKGDVITAYNPSTDRNKDGKTTVGEALARIGPILKQGQTPQHFLPAS